MRYTMTSRRIKFGIFAFLLLAVLLVCGAMVGREIFSRQKEKEDFEQLVQMVTIRSTPAPTPTGAPSASAAPEETPTPQPEVAEKPARDLSQLFAMNDDFVGWLCIPGTDINYPVMHTTDDPERYLRRNFDGEYSESGVPFLDFRCSLDSDNLIIYGHNMMNGTMFAELRGYVNEVFCNEHPIIEFQTETACNQYKVFAVVQVKSNDEWYRFITAEKEEDFNKGVEKITGMALFTNGDIPAYGRQLLTLSTCYDSAHNGRLLIISAKI